ncbi:glycosyltransferase family 4 protein [Sulfitobacter sp. S0837]|uniref:glycosyltransferase family 4 protein n=1 Tax=Sulfitobacter maritimus TaxID=2741719 RepID=UPI001581B3D8|nr:glycosyltransferase family 4 protein [Sulfitobacter maritimus]NUH65505.1 glycosyltransferase family 4 protein [Sulfitobacter maritimus]
MKTIGPVLIVCFSRSFGGADVRVLQTARWLASQNISYVVAVLEGTTLHQRLREEGLSARAFRFARGDPRLALELVKLARKERSRVIDAHNMQSQYWAALAGRVLRLPSRVATVHSVYRQTHPDFPRRHLHEGALRFCARSGFCFIAVNHVVDGYLKRHFVRASSQVVLSQNGLEPLTASVRAHDLRQAAGWPTGGILLGTVGRLETVKGHRHLFTAISHLKKKGLTDLRLYIAGTGRDEAALRAQVHSLGLEDQVYFGGFQTDIPAVLAGLDLLCQPSDSEALPYSVLEACRQAVPVLASDLPGITSVLKDGETGFVFEGGNDSALARYLECLRENANKRHTVGVAAQAMVLRDFGIDRMMESTLAAYRGDSLAR